jgi:single-stranded DNA-binding protein
MDNITILGNVGADPLITNVNNNDVINLNVAVSVGFGEHKSTTWYNVSFWNKASINYIKQGITKGSIVLIVGKFLRVEEYESNGVKKSKLKLMGVDIKALNKPEVKKEALNDNDIDLDDDLPF